MIRVAIVEDEKNCCEQICSYLKQYEQEYDANFQITVFQDGLDIVENYNPVWDIIFMDIKMKHMDGMAAAAKIRQYDAEVVLIFVTTMAQYAIKGYEVDALDFILKPVSYPQFAMKVAKAMNMLKKKEEKSLLLPLEDCKKKVSVKDVLFIEVKGHELHVATADQIYILRCSMQEMEADLKKCFFSRCHNSYLVNLRHVAEVRKEEIIVKNYTIPISRTRKKIFLEELSDYISADYS